MAWLPRPNFQEKKELQLTRASFVSSLRFSEFLAEKNILFFSGGENKLQIIEALVASFPSLDSQKVLTALWGREREGALAMFPGISIMRARVDNLLHVQAAVGICPCGFPDPTAPDCETRIVILLLSPADRLRIHLRFLTEISALFRDKTIARTLLRLRSPREVINVLREADSLVREPPGPWQVFKRFFAGLFPARALF